MRLSLLLLCSHRGLECRGCTQYYYSCGGYSVALSDYYVVINIPKVAMLSINN